MANGIKPTDFPAIAGELTGTEEIYTQTNGVNEKFTVDNIKEYLGVIGTPMYVEVEVSSEEFLNLDSTPKQLIDTSSLNSNQYITFTKFIIEYYHNTTQYAFGLGGDIRAVFGSSSVYSISATQLSSTNDLYVEPSKLAFSIAVPITDDFELISTRSVSNGDGTLKVKIWYTIETFG
jgi:hypothetical protein